MNKWTLGTIIGSALLAVSKKTSGSTGIKKMPNGGIVTIEEVSFFILRDHFHNPEKIDSIQRLVGKNCIGKDQCLELINEVNRSCFPYGDHMNPYGRRSLGFIFPIDRMLHSFDLLRFDIGFRANRIITDFLQQIVPKTWQQDTDNVRFFTQKDTVTLWQSGVDEQGEEGEEYSYEDDKVWHYDRLDEDSDFPWNGVIPRGDWDEHHEVRDFDKSEEYFDGYDGREDVLVKIFENVNNHELSKRIIKILYACVLTHLLKSFDTDSIAYIVRSAGYDSDYNNHTYPNIQILSNGFSNDLHDFYDEPAVHFGSFRVMGLQEGDTSKFYEGLRHFAQLESNKLFELIMSCPIEGYQETNGNEITITLLDLFHTVSFTSEVDVDSWAGLAFDTSLNVDPFIQTKTIYKTGYVELFLFLKSLRPNDCDDAIKFTPKWFQDWYKKGGLIRKKNISKLRRR